MDNRIAADNCDEIVGEGVTCEVTGAPKLTFPLGMLSEGGDAAAIAESPTESCSAKRSTLPGVRDRHRRHSSCESSGGEEGARRGKGFQAAMKGVTGALRSLNGFAAVLAEADDAVKRGGGEGCGGSAPYRMPA